LGFEGRMSGVAALAIAVLPYRRKASRWGDVTHFWLYARDLGASTFFHCLFPAAFAPDQPAALWACHANRRPRGF
jgi:hypothetical protein